VNHQAPGPESMAYFMRTLLLIAFLWMGYEMGRPGPAAGKEQGLLPDTTSQEQDWGGLPPWQRAASRKAVERYAMAQEKKWRRWNEAMFEPGGTANPGSKRNRREAG
jgi:hypothetical protein